MQRKNSNPENCNMKNEVALKKPTTILHDLVTRLQSWMRGYQGSIFSNYCGQYKKLKQDNFFLKCINEIELLYLKSTFYPPTEKPLTFWLVYKLWSNFWSDFQELKG